MYRAFIKDQLDLASKPKAYVQINGTMTINEDRLTTANSTINVNAVPSNVSNGDIIEVYNDKGLIRYKGVIKSIEGNTIQTSQITHLLSGQWLYETQPSGTLESEIKAILGRYCQGYIKGSTYQDPVILAKLGAFTIETASNTTGNLETMDENTQMDMETFIYSLYEKYGIAVDFDIPDKGQPIIKIWRPEFTSFKIGNNTNAIVNITPLTEIAETNRLIIFSKDGQYRTTYVAKSDGTIAEQPQSLAGRFSVVNSKIVFSDDELDDIRLANLPETMYNHKLTFVLNLNNLLYSYDDLKFDLPLEIWNGQDYYRTKITGRSFSKDANVDVAQVQYICGLVRTKLSDKLSMRLGVIR